MNFYRVSFLYHRSNKVARPVAAAITVMARNAEEAREGFLATHPAATGSFYAITSVEALAFGELF